MVVFRTFLYENFSNPLLLFQGAVFCTAVLLFMVIYFLLTKPKKAAGRLDKLVSSQKQGKTLSLLEEKDKGLPSVVSTAVYDVFAGKDDEQKIKKKRLKLIQAGIRSQQAYRHYIACKIILAMLFPFLFFYYSSSYSFNLFNLVVSCCTALAGFLIPEIYVAHRREQRRERIAKGLPDALDLMVICVTAGLGIDMMFKRVATELSNVWEELSEEFYLTNLEVRAGISRNECYKNMALRTGVPEVKGLMTMLAQTNRFGTSVGDALRVHADGMRIKRRQVSEEKAAKTAVKIMIPLVLFILPSLLVVLVGPAVIRVAQTLIPALSGH